MGKAELIDPRAIDKRNAQYLIEGLSVALLNDPSVMKLTRKEFENYVPKTVPHFDKPKKRHTKALIFSLILIALVPSVYIIREFQINVGLTHELSIIMVGQILAIFCTVIAVALFRGYKK